MTKLINANQKFKLTIKDPSFLNVRDPMFTFHFGKISLRSLIACNNNGEKNLCAHAQSESPKIDIGIENKLKSYLDDIEANFCPTRSLMHRTCIQKYGQKHYIIMQPSSSNFSTTIADINAYNLTASQRKAYERAKLQGQNNFEYAGRIYRVDDIDNQYIEKVMPDIEFKSDQKLDNGLIIKLIEYESKTVNFVSFLDKPSQTNKCIKDDLEYRKELCWCNDKCSECYDNIQLQIRYIAIGEKRPNKSIQCDQIPQYGAYNFDSVEMATEFHGKNLSMKQAFIYVPPSICLSKSFEKGLYNLKLVFNDVAKQAHSSLFNRTRLKYKLFKIEYKHLNVSEFFSMAKQKSISKCISQTNKHSLK